MDHLHAIVTHVVSTWSYYAVFGMLAVEGFGLFFLPGETTLIAAAIIAGSTGKLRIVFVLLAGYAGAILGDNTAFLVGRHFGFDLIRRYGPYIRINQRRIKYAQYLYLRYGGPIVFVGRFIMLLRSWESFLAGANLMRWKRFFPVNAAATLLWVCAWGLGAYGLREAGQTLLESVGLGTLGIFTALIIGLWTYFHRHEEELEARSEAALPGPLRDHRPEDVVRTTGGGTSSAERGKGDGAG